MVKSLKVFGKHYKVIEKKQIIEDETDCFGLLLPEKGEIHLKKSMKANKKTLTLFHEEMHAIVERIGMNDCIENNVEEILITAIETYVEETYYPLKRRSK